MKGKYKVFVVPYLAKVSDHFLDERTHGSNVNDLELVHVYRSIRIQVLADLPQDAKESHIRLSCSLGEATQRKSVSHDQVPRHTSKHEIAQPLGRGGSIKSDLA